jgi:REP element-mobilizing transposase RayT
MNRGAARQDLFVDTSDRFTFLHQLGEARDRFGIEVHAFALMTTHYHLLVRSPFANLGSAMQFVGSRFTQLHNRRFGRDGAIFRGRYHAVLVDSERYLKVAAAYIHRNPVEAGLVQRAEEYAWSSMSSYTKSGIVAPWLSREVVSAQFSDIASHRRFVDRLPHDAPEAWKPFDDPLERDTPEFLAWAEAQVLKSQEPQATQALPNVSYPPAN